MSPYFVYAYRILFIGGILLTSESACVFASSKGFEYYVNHEFDLAIEACKDKKDNFSRMIAALAYAERFRLYKNSADKAQKKAFMNILEEVISLKDLADIERVTAVKGNPFGSKEAKKLLKRAFANLRTTEDVLIAADFLNKGRDPSHNKIALDAIAKFLKQIRSYVNKGGTMPTKEKELFTDDRVIIAIVDLLEIKENVRSAKKCLTLIEEPALEYLEDRPINTSISDTIVAIRKATTKRQKKYPHSTWFSATGT